MLRSPASHPCCFFALMLAVACGGDGSTMTPRTITVDRWERVAAQRLPTDAATVALEITLNEANFFPREDKPYNVRIKDIENNTVIATGYSLKDPDRVTGQSKTLIASFDIGMVQSMKPGTVTITIDLPEPDNSGRIREVSTSMVLWVRPMLTSIPVSHVPGKCNPDGTKSVRQAAVAPWSSSGSPSAASLFLTELRGGLGVSRFVRYSYNDSTQAFSTEACWGGSESDSLFYLASSDSLFEYQPTANVLQNWTNLEKGKDATNTKWMKANVQLAASFLAQSSKETGSVLVGQKAPFILKKCSAVSSVCEDYSSPLGNKGNSFLDVTYARDLHWWLAVTGQDLRLWNDNNTTGASEPTTVAADSLMRSLATRPFASTMTDIDQDGLADLLFASGATLYWLPNIGTNDAPKFADDVVKYSLELNGTVATDPITSLVVMPFGTNRSEFTLVVVSNGKALAWRNSTQGSVPR